MHYQDVYLQPLPSHQGWFLSGSNREQVILFVTAYTALLLLIWAVERIERQRGDTWTS